MKGVSRNKCHNRAAEVVIWMVFVFLNIDPDYSSCYSNRSKPSSKRSIINEGVTVLYEKYLEQKNIFKYIFFVNNEKSKLIWCHYS